MRRGEGNRSDWSSPSGHILTFRFSPWFFAFSSSFSESPDELPDYPLFISIGDWLDSIKMCQYKNNFLAAGYTTLDSISTMSIE